MLNYTVGSGAGGVFASCRPLLRLLVATAREAAATVVTADERILGYGADTSAVRAHDARTCASRARAARAWAIVRPC